ncbi:MAG: alpha/beta fold hydrolase [Pseudomonadota bacterium]
MTMSPTTSNPQTVGERIVRFGEEGNLVGLLNDTGGMAGSDVPAILFFNAGIVHRIGSHRLNVKLARSLSALGYPTLRFDLSGQGDSLPARAAHGHEAQALADIKAAAETLVQETGNRPLISVGMCSGADHSYRAALADPQIAGIVLLDPYAYGSLSAKVDAFVAKATDRARWRRLLGRVAGAAPVADPRDAGAQLSEAEFVDQGRIPVPPAEFGADLETIAARGGRVAIRYTGFVKDHITRPEQFFETFKGFDFKGRVEVVVLPQVDHTYTELSAQQHLIADLTAWLAAHWPAA